MFIQKPKKAVTQTRNCFNLLGPIIPAYVNLITVLRAHMAFCSPTRSSQFYYSKYILLSSLLSVMKISSTVQPLLKQKYDCSSNTLLLHTLKCNLCIHAVNLKLVQNALTNIYILRSNKETQSKNLLRKCVIYFWAFRELKRKSSSKNICIVS